MNSLIAIFLGGGIGSILRHLISSKIGSHWGIMLVNILGALMIGMAYQYFLTKVHLRPEYKAFIITGLLGGFTTFSTYMLDFNLLINNQKTYEGLVYLLGSIIVGIGFLFIGIKLAKLWF